jgi:hypothetical protein
LRTPHARPGVTLERLRVAAGTAVLVAVCTGLGAFVARGTLMAYFLLGALALVAASAIFAGHLFTAFATWVAVEGLAYPFVRYPLHHDLVTFDRVILIALGGALILAPSSRLSRDAQLLVRAVGAFTIVYGVRAFLTTRLPAPPKYAGVDYADIAPYQEKADWLDNIALPYIALLVAARVVTLERWRVIARALVFLGVTTALIGIGEWTLGFHLSQLSGSSAFVDLQAGVVRVSGPYSDPSAYGGVLVVCIAATVYWMETERAYFAGAAALLVELVGLAPSFTKTIWAAGFVTLLIALGIRRGASSRTFLVTLYGGTVLAFIYSFLQDNPVVAQRVTGSTSNFTARLGDYLQALLIFQEWPIFGAGAGQFVAAQQFVPPVVVSDVLATPSAHNSFLSVLAELGLVGFIPLMVVVFAIARIVRNTRRLAQTREEVIFGATVLGATVGHLLLSMTLLEIYYSPSITVLAVVLGAAAARMSAMQTAQAESGVSRATRPRSRASHRPHARVGGARVDA